MRYAVQLWALLIPPLAWISHISLSFSLDDTVQVLPAVSWHWRSSHQRLSQIKFQVPAGTCQADKFRHRAASQGEVIVAVVVTIRSVCFWRHLSLFARMSGVSWLWQTCTVEWTVPEAWRWESPKSPHSPSPPSLPSPTAPHPPVSSPTFLIAWCVYWCSCCHLKIYWTPVSCWLALTFHWCWKLMRVVSWCCSWSLTMRTAWLLRQRLWWVVTIYTVY